jgi:DNA-binding PadR family transcriptional regulator
VTKNDNGNIQRGKNMQTETNYSSSKVSRNRLSNQMKFILVNTGDGVARGEIFSRYYGLERRYCGYYTDPCLCGKSLQEFEQLYHGKQPVFSKSLKKLEKKGLVKLIKHGRYVKKIQLTPEGHLVAAELAQTNIEEFKSKENKKNGWQALEKHASQNRRIGNYGRFHSIFETCRKKSSKN